MKKLILRRLLKHVFQDVDKRSRSVSALSKPRALVRGASNGLIFLLVLGVVSSGICLAQDATTKASPEKKEDISDIKYCNEIKNFDECKGQVVRIKGSLSYIQQHTIYVPNLNTTQDKIQNSLNTQYGDIVILTQDEVHCGKNIEAKGLLDIIETDCPEGVKCIPKEYFVIVNEWECKE